MFADQTLSLLAKTDKLSSLPTEKPVKVGDWTTSELGLVTYGYWMTKSLRYIQDGVVVSTLTLTDYEKARRTEYRLDGKIYINGSSSDSWVFGSPGHILESGWEEDYSVTKTELVISRPALYNSKPAIWEITLTRSLPQ